MVTIVNSTNTNDICLICGIVQSSIKWTIISNCRNHDYVISCYLPYLVTKLATKNSNKEMLLYTQQERISKYEDKSCNKIMVSSNINVMIEKKRGRQNALFVLSNEYNHYHFHKNSLSSQIH